MAVLLWDQENERLYETGVKKVALFTTNDQGDETGVAWNGITNITESPSGADITKLYANDGVYANLQAAEEFGGTIEAYTYPDEFAACDGSATPVAGMKIGQQTRKPFNIAYITTVGNDTEGTGYGQKLHFVYGCLATPSERAYATINESPEAITFSWEYQSTPVEVNLGDGKTYNKVSVITVDSETVGATKFQALCDIVYGTSSEEPKFPKPNEIYDTLQEAA